MLTRIYYWYVHRHRDYKFKNYLARYERRQRESSGNTVIWGHPIAMFSYAFGRDLRRSILSESPHSGWITRIIQPFHGLIGFLVAFAVMAVVAAITSVVLSELLFVPLLHFSVLPILHAHYLARKDLKKVKSLRGTTQQDLPAATEQAYRLLDHRQVKVREAAFRVVQQSFEQSPGKAVKHISSPPAQVRDTLLDKLEKDDIETKERALICLKWFSRDFGDLLIESGGKIASYLESNHSVFQAQAAITIGNIGGYDPDRTTEYTKVLTDAVKDPDADVRHAAAVALRERVIELFTHYSQSDYYYSGLLA